MSVSLLRSKVTEDTTILASKNFEVRIHKEHDVVAFVRAHIEVLKNLAHRARRDLAFGLFGKFAVNCYEDGLVDTFEYQDVNTLL